MTQPVFQAGYLPGLTASEVAWQTLSFMNVQVQVPRLSLEQMARLTARIRHASRTQLKAAKVSDIVQIVDQAVLRLLDPNDTYRQQLDTWLPQVTGFDSEMVRLGLTSYLKTFRAMQLHRFIAEDFVNPKVLDEFQPSIKGGFNKALGPDVLLHLWAGNVPGLPLWSFVSGLLVKAGSIGKISSDEPVFASVLARLMAELAPQWADCFAVLWWKGGDEAYESAVFSQANTIMAYGGNDTLEHIKRRVPVATRFLPHGHKLSFGVVAATALSVNKASHVAQLAALDVVRYDQQGCYSPHVFFVERGARVPPKTFAQQLAQQLDALGHKFPQRQLTLEEATTTSHWRHAHELQQLQQPNSQVLSEAHHGWTVVYTDATTPLMPGPLNRCVQVVAVNQLDDVMACIEPQRHVLQTVGLACSPEELLAFSEKLGAAGVTRICALGAMTSPEAGWHHDGRFSLLDLVQMVEIEHSTELSSNQFTVYEA